MVKALIDKFINEWLNPNVLYEQQQHTTGTAALYLFLSF